MAACILMFSGCLEGGKTSGIEPVAEVEVERILPEYVEPGSEVTVRLKMSVGGGKTPYAVGLVEEYPEGWFVHNISTGGVRKTNPDRIEWLFWGLGSPVANKTLTYVVKVPENYSGNALFRGVVHASKRRDVGGVVVLSVAG